MDKVFSIRLNEDLIRQANRFAKERAMSKKALMEKALRMYLSRIGGNLEQDILNRTFGSWQRAESADETWRRVRQEFNKAFN